jgi:hypothetical protein
MQGYGGYSAGSGHGLVLGSCEHGNKPLCSIKDEEFTEISCATLQDKYCTSCSGLCYLVMLKDVTSLAVTHCDD